MIPAARPFIGSEEREAVDEVLKSGLLAQGQQVAEAILESASKNSVVHLTKYPSGG